MEEQKKMESETNNTLREIKKKLGGNERLKEKNKNLEETNKKLENKLEEKSKNVEETNKKVKKLVATNKCLENKLEETSKNVVETNKKLVAINKHRQEICNKDHNISYEVSSSGKAAKDRSDCMGKYYHTGAYSSSFPIFRKDDKYLYVFKTGVWMIGSDAGHAKSFIYHPDNNPTPSTPPRNGWKYSIGSDIYWEKVANRTWQKDTSLTVSVISRTILTPYRVSSNSFPPEDGLGNYYPTGYCYKNGFPVFQSIAKHDWKLYVNTDQWRIGKDGDEKKCTIYHPDEKPTPLTPPPFGWKFSNEKDDELYSSSLSVIAITGETSAPASQ